MKTTTKFLLLLLLVVGLFLFVKIDEEVMAGPCPCTGSPGGSYTYSCTNAGTTYCPTGECCVKWPKDSCGCPSWTGCSSDTCSNSCGACGGGSGSDDCSQPCGACFPCDSCATKAGSTPDGTPLMLSFDDAAFGEFTEEEIAECESVLVSNVQAAESDVVQEKTSVQWAYTDTLDWFQHNWSAFMVLGFLTSIITGGVWRKN